MFTEILVMLGLKGRINLFKIILVIIFITVQKYIKWTKISECQNVTMTMKYFVNFMLSLSKIGTK